MDGENAARYSSGAHDYPERAAESVIEMRRQVGDLVVDENGVAVRGLIVRHLVLPRNLAGTDPGPSVGPARPDSKAPTAVEAVVRSLILTAKYSIAKSRKAP